MAKHFFTPEHPTVPGAYWLRRKDKPANLVRVWKDKPVAYAEDVDRQYSGPINNGDFEGDWLGPIEPKEGIPLGFLKRSAACPSREHYHDGDGTCSLLEADPICPSYTIPDYCPLRGE